MFRRTPNIDLDASALLLDADGKLAECVYYGHRASTNNAVYHTGDNITGEGEEDDETILVSLEALPQSIHRLVFTVNIYSCATRKQDFGLIENAYIRLLDCSTGAEICRYNLSDDYAGKTAILVAEVYRCNGEWKFAATGRGLEDTSISVTASRYK